MSSVVCRPIEESDFSQVQAYFALRGDTTMVLQSNLAEAGLRDRGQVKQGTYVGGFLNGKVVSLAAHYWNGRVAFDAVGQGALPPALIELARLCLTLSGRGLLGFMGPDDALDGIRGAFWPHTGLPVLDTHEVLYALDLDQLKAPKSLSTREVAVRMPRAADREIIVDFRMQYLIEIAGFEPGPGLQESAQQFVDLANGRQWLLESQGQIVAYCAFVAAVSRRIQVGGVFTPPAFRSRGFARSVVAGALRAAADNGTRRAVLFTDSGNTPARRAYESLGFCEIGGYGQFLLASSINAQD